MKEFIINFYNYHYYWLVPVLTWIGIQLFKFIYDRVETGKWHKERLMGSGGMPSSHSALVMCLATIVGKQAKIINEILLKKEITGEEKLKELVGHTPFQVLIGSIIGFIVGIIMPLKF